MPAVGPYQSSLHDLLFGQVICISREWERESAVLWMRLAYQSCCSPLQRTAPMACTPVSALVSHASHDAALSTVDTLEV